MLSLTFCYIYYHKLIIKADFYSFDSSAGIYPVLNFEAIKVLQYRMLVPFVFKFFSLFFAFSDKAVYFILCLVQTVIILYLFRLLLDEFFENRQINALIAPVIMYPMVWNYIILNGQTFYVDFSILIFILLGYILILKNNIPLLVLTFFIGCLNHDSIGFIIVMYVLYNYKKIFTLKVILTALIMTVIFVGVKYTLSQVFINNFGVSFRMNHERNFSVAVDFSDRRLFRNVFLVYGGLHIIVLLGLKSYIWKKLSPEKIAINFTFFPYIFLIFFIHTIDEIRNYIASIPFIIIPFLVYISSMEGSFLRLKEK
jgi:hypothetical protein